MNSSASWIARYTFDDILGTSSPLREAIRLARRAADGDYPTILVGESGTGKELLAHAIHNASAWRDGPFVAVNCGTLCGDIAIAELCGYEPGSFTGADRRARAGFLDAARGGTLFLDELQDMPSMPQSVMLRFLETGRFVRVGGTSPVRAPVRVLAACNIPLADLMATGRIRSDLLFRLNCLAIEIAPLRARRTDIRPIAEKSLREDLHYLGGIDDSVWQALEESPYRWPGNAREVRNVLLKTIVFASSDRLMVSDLPREVTAPPSSVEQTVSPASRNRSYFDIRAEEVDLVALKAVLRASHHNVSEAARRLGIHRSTLYRRLGQGK